MMLRRLACADQPIYRSRGPRCLAALLKAKYAIAPEVIAIGRKLQKALKDYRNAVIQDNQIKQERFGSADNIPF